MGKDNHKDSSASSYGVVIGGKHYTLCPEHSVPWLGSHQGLPFVSFFVGKIVLEVCIVVLLFPCSDFVLVDTT